LTQRVLAGGLVKDRRYFGSGIAGFAALGLLFAICDGARAEEPIAPDAADVSAPAVHTGNPQHKGPAMVRGIDPAFLDAVGRWIDSSMEDFNIRMKAAHGRFVAFGESGRSVTDASSREFTDSVRTLPSGRVVGGRERCEIASNGAPDCNAAVETMCRSGGFSSGHSLDTQAVQKCPARIWLSGQVPQAGECLVEAFVNRALCQ
jgi:hypothetical protein